MIKELISRAFRSNAQVVLGKPRFPGFRESATLAISAVPETRPNSARGRS